MYIGDVDHRVQEQLGAFWKLVPADAQRRFVRNRPRVVEKHLVDAGAEHLDVRVETVVVGEPLFDAAAARQDRQR